MLDTTGACDVFTAGLLAAWLVTLDAEPAALLDGGMAVAAAVVRQAGAR